MSFPPSRMAVAGRAAAGAAGLPAPGRSRADRPVRRTPGLDCLTVGALDQLPALTPAAEALIEELDRQARSRGWNKASRNNGAKTLRILLAWIGAGAPIHEADIRALSARPGTTIRRVLQFLGERGMVIPDPARQGTAVQRTIQQRIQALPDGIASELRQWVKVVRGEGRRAHRELPFATIRSYLNCFYPVLAGWSQRDHQPARDHPRRRPGSARRARPGVTARNLLPALRSLFRALKQERIIFRDPTSGITLPAMRRLPVPIPTDQLRGLIDRADGPIAKLDRRPDRHPRARQERNNPPADSMTSTCPAASLLVRRPHRTAHRLPRRAHPHAQRPPGSANGTAAGPSPRNPHLLVTGQTADDDHEPADRPHRHRRHLRQARPHPFQTPPGPDPGRGQAHRRPRPPHARLRPQRQTRHELRPGGPSRTPLEVSSREPAPHRTPKPQPRLGSAPPAARNRRTCALSAHAPRPPLPDQRRQRPPHPGPRRERSHPLELTRPRHV